MESVRVLSDATVCAVVAHRKYTPRSRGIKTADDAESVKLGGGTEGVR